VKYKLPACASAVMEKGRLTALGVAGVRRVDRGALATTDDLWQLGSCTKSMTAVLTGLLVDAGKLRWEMPVSDAFPSGECDPAWKKTTVWDLVTHQSGLGEIWLPDEVRISGHNTPREQRIAFARSVLQRPMSGPPGKFAYSNAGYAILGAMLERATDEDYGQLLRKYLFTPLALRSAGFGPPATPGRIDQPWGHRRISDRLFPMNPWTDRQFPPLLAPAAAVHMSITDFVRYAAWQSVGNPALMKAETFAKLRTAPAGSSYSGGVWRSELPGIGGEALCHTGTVGGPFAVFYAGRDCACVSVFNTEGIGWEWLGDEILSRVLKAVRADPDHG